jgi:GTP pyrophosphokinase
MARLEDIIELITEYNPAADIELLRKAYVFSGVVHQGQTRLSGEPYLSHPIEVAHILAGLKMDIQCVATGLLHDTVEDTYTTLEKIEETFGPDIAHLVDGVTKISSLTFEKKADHEAENFRKMIFAMSKDIRVILVKLADRLHNMRTLNYMSRDKQKIIATETIEIYAPLANRLGIGAIKNELEDLAFRYQEPQKYERLKKRVIQETDAWEKYITNVKSIILEKLKDSGLKGEIVGRLKHLYSINKKMEEQDLEFENIHDVIAFRIIVDSVSDCYAVVGIIHSIWKPVPGRFKDYIALPKSNMYQSLHTTVVGPYGIRMEVQIRTDEMHRVSEFGIASHWKYKEGGEIESKDDKSFAWLKQLLEWQRDLKDSFEFMETFKVDLFPEEVFVFTPKGAIKHFSVGATPIDFAYAIHTDVGHRCAGAKVNGKMVPLRTKLRNGDVVDIITSNSHNPSKDWLNYVVSARARTRIRHWIKTADRTKSIELGREMCEKEFVKHGLNYSTLLKSGELKKIGAESFGLNSIESLLASIGYGKIPILTLLGKILPKRRFEARQKFSFRSVFGRFKSSSKLPKSPVLVHGEENILVKFAQCCNPLPGDEIKGYITQGQGVSIHAYRCANLLHIDSDRMIDVAWDVRVQVTRPVIIEVLCKNEKGLLAEMTRVIMAADANISSAEIGTNTDNKSACVFVVEVKGTAHLKDIMNSLKQIKRVFGVQRVTQKLSATPQRGVSSTQ